jgi:hypothetical protein
VERRSWDKLWRKLAWSLISSSEKRTSKTFVSGKMNLISFGLVYMWFAFGLRTSKSFGSEKKTSKTFHSRKVFNYLSSEEVFESCAWFQEDS